MQNACYVCIDVYVARIDPAQEACPILRRLNPRSKRNNPRLSYN